MQLIPSSDTSLQSSLAHAKVGSWLNVTLAGRPIHS